jgi:hypothetical protein
MTYRDTLEALRARQHRLQNELDEVRQTIKATKDHDALPGTLERRMARLCGLCVRRRRRIAAIGAACVSIGCAFVFFRHYVRAPSFESLPRPVVLATDPVPSNCNATVAVDRDGDVWHESECEERSSGVNRDGRLTSEQRARFWSAVARLRQVPQDPNGRPCPEPPAGDRRMTRVAIDETDGSTSQWYVCHPASGETWPEPFGTVFSSAVPR